MPVTRDISPQLQAHLDSGATTLTYFMRIKPVQPGFSDVGITMLDKTQDYDDGEGMLTYEAPIGMVPATLSFSSEMDVDNSQQQHLVPEFELPISEADIASGAYDFAEFVVYLVNYADLTMGHVWITGGQLGRLTVQDGLTFTSELTGLSKPLKQTIVEKDSITCRAIFGSQPLGTPQDSTGWPEVTQRFPCGKDTRSMWAAYTVTAVGLETNRTFTGSFVAADGTYEPGMVEWLTGANAGRTYEVEEQTAGVVNLSFETMFPIQAGDTGRIRADCTKWKDGPNGCKFHFNDIGPQEWKLHYRGEPLIPVQDSDQLNTPGATVGAGLGGGTT